MNAGATGAEGAPPRRSRAYVLCTTPRSGSTLLCRALAATGVAGRPDSHFHASSLRRWLEVHGLEGRAFASERDALRALFEAVRARGSGPSGVFGLRMQRRSFPHWMRRLDALHPGRPTDVARIEAAFGPTSFVHLSRADKLAQAVSLLRAEQSGLWHRAADGTELERLGPPATPRYDADAIARHSADLSAQDDAWRAWFAREGVTPLRLGYETLAADPAGAVARVIDALGLESRAARSVVPATARLADATSTAWIERFRTERGPGAGRVADPSL